MQTTYADVESTDLEVCKASLRAGSKSFALASLLLARRVREPAAAVYAFCRMADDLIDEGEGGEGVLNALSSRLERAYAGHPIDDPIDRAFSVVVRRHAIPEEIPRALLEGFSWDAAGRSYESIEDVRAYSARVAGTVGVMMTLLMGRREAVVLERACDLGVAMQLTNIARDVGEDARNGRVYLPAAWLREEGVDPASLSDNPRFTPALGNVVRRLVVEAETLYARADVGIALLPADSRVAIRAARLIYADIGLKLARSGYDSVSRRTVVGKPRKIWLALRAMFSRAPGESLHLADATSYSPLPETQFLVDASALLSGPKLLTEGSR